jgi:hypothetical protein
MELTSVDLAALRQIAIIASYGRRHAKLKTKTSKLTPLKSECAQRIGSAGRPYAAPSIRQMISDCGPACSTALEVDMLISIRWRKLRFFKSALGVGVAVFALTGAATMAQANPYLYGDFNLSVYWTASALPGGGGSSEAMANPGNPLIAGANLLGTGVYSGELNFGIPTGGTNTVGAFLTSAPGGTFSSSTYNLGLSTSGTSLFNSTNQMSASGFVGATIMVFTGNLGAGDVFGIVAHDYGATLRDGFNGSTYTNFVGGQAFLTPGVAEAYTGLTGAFEVIYAEVNALPAYLIVTLPTCDPSFPLLPGACLEGRSYVPLPATLPLFAAGLGALGLLGWRRKRKAAAIA